MKSIELEFEPGQEVHQMLGTKPIVTRVRAYEAKGSVEFSSDVKGEQKSERIRETVMYSTIAKPNDPVSADKLGATKEELMNKMFANVANPVPAKQKQKQKDEPTQ